jgi:hypothetical protein
MTDDFITVTAGAPQVDIEPGVYVVTLVDISEPRTIFPQTGPNAGKEVTLRDWTFALDDGTEIRGSASTASGPKSKTYAWLTALLGGTPPVVGQSYPKPQLVGRLALATISIDEGGWPKIQNLSAMPRQQVQAPAAAPAAAAPAAPAAPRSRAAAQPVAAAATASNDLPF